MIRQIAIGVAISVTSTLIVDAIRLVRVKNQAFNYARALAGSKGIINLGAGPHRTLLSRRIAEAPDVVANIDIVPNGVPHYIQMNIERDRLPFSNKCFGCSLLSHVLEHLQDWRFALNEAVRVADHTVVVLPHPLSPLGWLCPEHKQHFSLKDIRQMQQDFPSVKIFY